MSLPSLRSSLSGPGLKLLIMAVLVLAFLIPLALVASIVERRLEFRDEAVDSIIEPEGGSPVLFGPYVLLPWAREGQNYVERGEILILPADLAVSGIVETALRERGLFSTPVVRAGLSLRGRIVLDAAQIAAALPAGATPQWSTARVRLELAEARSLADTPSISLGEERLALGVESEAGFILDRAIGAAVKVAAGQDLGFDASLVLRGGPSLRVVEPAGEVKVELSGAWPSPSFRGSAAPVERRVDNSGFDVAWYIPASAQYLPSIVSGESAEKLSARDSGFGVDLLPGVDAYAMSERAVRYGLLFIVVPFAILFLFELLSGARLHPVQYVLVGLADCLFYLLLLSFSELLPFGAAYAMAAAACSAMVVSYAVVALRSTRGLLMAPALALLYGYLYFSLSSEDYALLIGSLGLFILLAALMYATRRIDWYGGRTD